MKILAFAASNSRKSINAKLIGYATSILEAEPGVEVETLDLNDYEMPLYSEERQEEGGIPEAAKEFFARIGQADALVISFAEHNGHYVAAYKNLFDWASRIDMRVYQDKPTVFFATSPGGGGGASVLAAAVHSAPFFGNDLKASLSVPSFYDNVNPATGAITNPDLDAEFRTALSTLTP